MRTNNIVAMDLRKSHPKQKAYATDSFYTKLANQLLRDFTKLDLDFGKQTHAIMRYAAIILANYMEDIVSDSGQWRSFSALCQQMFATPIPMYHCPDSDYYPDEPCFEVVRFLVWHSATEMDDIWWYAEERGLWRMAVVAFNRLDSVFEQAPVNADLAEDIASMLGKASGDFLAARMALLWILLDCYLTRGVSTEELIQKRLDDIKDFDAFREESMRLYYAYMHSIFDMNIGPLALKSKDYLAALMRTLSMPDAAQVIDAIEVLPFAKYKYTIEEDGQWMQLLRTNGQRLRLARTEITIDDQKLRRYDGFGAVFVKFLDNWRLNGVMIPIENIASLWDELVKHDPSYTQEGAKDLTGEMLLELNGGRQALYFADAEELKLYMQQTLRYQNFSIDFPKDVDPVGKHVVLFIDKKAKKYAVHLTFGFTHSIADPDNPYYDADKARDNAIEMLWNDQAVSTQAILYLLEHDYLPDIYKDPILNQKNTDEQKRSDILFLLRYMRRENY